MKTKTKKDLVDYLATAGLIMILTVQVQHLTGLYLTYSRLSAGKAELMGYFIGCTLEMLVFIFVWKGSKEAGRWFAVLLFFAGIFFNDNWQGTVIDIHFHPWDWKDFHVNKVYIPLKFISSTLIQLMSTIAIVYLSDLHAKSKEEQDVNTRIQDLYTRETELNTRLSEIQQQIEERERFRVSQFKELKDKKNDLIQLDDMIKGRRVELTELNTRLSEIEAEIISMKKAKAGMSTRKQKEV